ncbi:replicative DNA helicase [Citrobacter sp. RHBSTW-00599]|uniref:replicative DNA helicase n=1 Tax=Citrobacter sp. RHBSTW-00599 TaxID=2742657 RepID=UPI0015EAC413|nr:replicative DNA helicase [Citrobacter sp. RHBSTW-00599]QLY02303.1 replicative DNA helicase [Citrobacter sp. RHBSTW-00599]
MRQDIEASVIGGLLLGGLTPAASDVLARMEADAFTIPLYRKAFEVIRKQARNRNLIDALMVAEECGDEHATDVMMTARACPSAANLSGYADMLADQYQRRLFLHAIDELRGDVSNGTLDGAASAMDELMRRLSTIRKPKTEVRPVRLGEVLNDYADTLESRLKNGDESDTMKTGIDELDAITGGMNAEDLVIIAARPGMGKTELALKIAEGVASRPMPGTDSLRGVLIFSMEMSNLQIAERSIAGRENMSVSVLRNPANMDDEGWARVFSAICHLKDLDVWMVDASKLTVEEIRSIAERHKQEHPSLSLILVDYLGLISKPKADRNDLAIAHISGSLKAMAKDLKSPVISLSQLSRDVEKRPNKRPTNADLRDSGSIEQDADSIIMLYREAVYDEHSPAAKFAEIIVTKNRFGSLGTVYQRFVNGHFMPCDQDEARMISTSKPSTGKRYAKGADV